MPGDFPVLRIVECNVTTVKPVLTDSSYKELSSMSDEKFARWWGYNLTYKEHNPSRIDSPIIDVSIGSGLSHIGDIILPAEYEQQSLEQQSAIICPMSCNSVLLQLFIVLFHYYMPIVTLYLRGFPKGTTPDTIIFLLRLFGPVYRVRIQEDRAICIMSSDAGMYNIVRRVSFSSIQRKLMFSLSNC